VADRLLSILAVFSPSRLYLTLSQITALTGLPHSTCHRLVRDLVEWGAMERLGDGRYAIGLRLWEVGTLSPRSAPIRHRAMPVMEDLFHAVRQHVQLGVLDNSEVLIIERISAPGAVKLVSQTGGRLPLHASALGKVLLAHAPTQVREAVLRQALQAYTPHTIVDPARLRAELAECRRRGFAVAADELTVGAHSVAAKVTDAGQNVLAAISVVTNGCNPTTAELIPAMLTAGYAISRRVRDSATAN
jgi:DNA-binding IclR family transcriptional regulator